jgi:hypothetical protein
MVIFYMSVTFMHPALKKSMTIIAPFAVDFQEAFNVMGFGKEGHQTVLIWPLERTIIAMPCFIWG